MARSFKTSDDFLDEIEKVRSCMIGAYVDIHEDEHFLRYGFLWQLKTIRNRWVIRGILDHYDIMRNHGISKELLTVSYLHTMPKKFLYWKPVLCRKLTHDACSVVYHTDAYMIGGTTHLGEPVPKQIKRTEVLCMGNKKGEHRILQDGESVRDAVKRFTTPVLVLWLHYHYPDNDSKNKKIVTNVRMIPVRDPIPGSFWERVLRRR